jgi:uncharacterized protein YjbJ (UPF0337 family)
VSPSRARFARFGSTDGRRIGYRVASPGCATITRQRTGQGTGTTTEEDPREKDEATGRVKEAAGDVTGDEGLEREGQAEQAEGKVKGAVDSAADKAKDAVNKD